MNHAEDKLWQELHTPPDRIPPEPTLCVACEERDATTKTVADELVCQTCGDDHRCDACSDVDLKVGTCWPPTFCPLCAAAVEADAKEIRWAS